MPRPKKIVAPVVVEPVIVETAVVAPTGASIDRKALSAALSTVKPAVGSKANEAVFTWVVIRDGIVSASNGSMIIERSLPIDGALPPIAAPYTLLADAVGAMSAPIIEMSATSSLLTMRSGGATVELELCDVEQYPNRPQFENGRLIVSMPGEQMAISLGLVVGAAAKDATRAMLQSVYVSAGAVAGADGFRAHTSGQSWGSHVLLQPTMVSAMLAALRGAGRVIVTVTANEHWASTTAGDVTIMGRLVSGHYPKIGDITAPFLADSAPTATVVIDDALEALRVALALRGDTPRISMELEKRTLTMMAHYGGATQATASVSVDAPYDLAWSIHVNGLYLRDALQTHALIGDRTGIIVTDAKQPLGVRNGDAVAVIMPMTGGAR